MKALATLLLPLILLSACTMRSSATTTPPPCPTVIGWIPFWDQEQGMQSYWENADLFDIVSFFWYRLDPQGDIQPYAEANEDLSLIRKIHQRGQRVHIVIANLADWQEGGGWDTERVQQVIGDPARRTAHIRDIMTLLREKGVDGVDIDYEALPAEQRHAFTAFIQELGKALHQENFTLGVALHPKTSEENPREDNGSHAQDWEAIADAADVLNLMAFGEHYGGGDPGPFASLPWVTRVLRYALQITGDRSETLALDIALAGQRWKRKDSKWEGVMEEELTLRRAQDLRNNEGIVLQWDDEAKSPFFRSQDGNEISWIENARSVAAKLDLATTMGIRSVGLWRLGGETDAIFPVLRTWKSRCAPRGTGPDTP